MCSLGAWLRNAAAARTNPAVLSLSTLQACVPLVLITVFVGAMGGLQVRLLGAAVQAVVSAPALWLVWVSHVP